MKQAIQTSLFPNIARPVLKPEPAPLERDFMLEVQHYATSLDLPSIHVGTYCGNAFNVECPCCGNKTLAHCRKTINRHLAGYPDLIGLAWGIETKRQGFEPDPRQVAVHEKLRRAGIPVIVVNPGNVAEALHFLNELKGGGKP
jgi:hypothetical protein